jgi:hypothetical protein
MITNSAQRERRRRAEDMEMRQQPCFPSYFIGYSRPRYSSLERKMGGHKALRAGGRGGGCRAERSRSTARNTAVLEQLIASLLVSWLAR